LLDRDSFFDVIILPKR